MKKAKEVTEVTEDDVNEEQSKSIDDEEEYQNNDDIIEQENLDINNILKNSGQLMFTFLGYCGARYKCI